MEFEKNAWCLVRAVATNYNVLCVCNNTKLFRVALETGKSKIKTTAGQESGEDWLSVVCGKQTAHGVFL